MIDFIFRLRLKLLTNGIFGLKRQDFAIFYETS